MNIEVLKNAEQLIEYLASIANVYKHALSILRDHNDTQMISSVTCPASQNINNSRVHTLSVLRAYKPQTCVLTYRIRTDLSF